MEKQIFNKKISIIFKYSVKLGIYINDLSVHFMAKTSFTIEIEINASPRTLYPYISTPDGLAQWFADEVFEDDEDFLVFIWDEKKHIARMAAKKVNSFAKFEFLPETDEDSSNPSWIEFKVEVNEMTNSTFLKIEDYSQIDNPDDYEEMYRYCLATLKEIVGGGHI